MIRNYDNIWAVTGIAATNVTSVDLIFMLVPGRKFQFSRQSQYYTHHGDPADVGTSA